MSFVEHFNAADIAEIKSRIYETTAEDVARVLNKSRHSLDDFTSLISPAGEDFLEEMARSADRITSLRFGRTVKLYAPLYVSNQCVNCCTYCGFRADNNISRVTLSIEDVLKEARALHAQGFRHILLVTGEDPQSVPVSCLTEIAEKISDLFDGISIEVYPMDQDDYELLAQKGVTGIAVYQETYDRKLYKDLHKGPKANFDYRLMTPERAAAAGFRELGIGALLGLDDFRLDMACVAMHAGYLMKKFWKSQVAISFPRIQSAEGEFDAPVMVSDKQLAQIIFALRIVLPDADLVLSTREQAAFRDGMAGVGITRMSAGSKTQPGGYVIGDDALEQFQVADTRTPKEIEQMLFAKGLEPVWKDFDRSFLFDR